MKGKRTMLKNGPNARIACGVKKREGSVSGKRGEEAERWGAKKREQGEREHPRIGN